MLTNRPSRTLPQPSADASDLRHLHPQLQEFYVDLRLLVLWREHPPIHFRICLEPVFRYHGMDIAQNVDAAHEEAREPLNVEPRRRHQILRAPVLHALAVEREHELPDPAPREELVERAAHAGLDVDGVDLERHDELGPPGDEAERLHEVVDGGELDEGPRLDDHLEFDGRGWVFTDVVLRPVDDLAKLAQGESFMVARPLRSVVPLEPEAQLGAIGPIEKSARNLVLMLHGRQGRLLYGDVGHGNGVVVRRVRSRGREQM